MSLSDDESWETCDLCGFVLMIHVVLFRGTMWQTLSNVAQSKLSPKRGSTRNRWVILLLLLCVFNFSSCRKRNTSMNVEELNLYYRHHSITHTNSLPIVIIFLVKLLYIYTYLIGLGKLFLDRMGLILYQLASLVGKLGLISEGNLKTRQIQCSKKAY